MKKYFNALKNYGRAFKVVFQHGFAGYLFIPGLLTMAVFIIFLALGIMFIDDLSVWLQGLLPQWEWIQSKAASVSMNILLGILAFFVFFISFKQVVLIVLSPVLSHLSEKVENKLTGVDPPKITVKEFLSDIWRGLWLNLINLGLELTLVFFAWLLGFIPVIGVVLGPLLIFLIQSFYAGFGLVDYTLERKRMSLIDSNKHAYKNKGEMMGVGSGMLLIMFIPILGWIVAPTLGTVAGTLVSMENLTGKPVEIDPKKIKAAKAAEIEAAGPFA